MLRARRSLLMAVCLSTGSKQESKGMDSMITIKKAAAEEAQTITRLMREAFRQTTPPSSSLLETAEQVHQQLSSGNKLAAIALQNTHT